MKVSRGPLHSAKQTAAEMERLVRSYSSDIGKLSKLPLARYYDLVKRLPFKSDPRNIENISRPSYTLRAKFPWRDCDDKAILLGSYCYQNKIPFRFIAISKRPDKSLHHVFVEARTKAGPLDLDATYPNMKLNQQLEGITKREALTGFIMPDLRVMEGAEMGFSLTKAVRKVGRVTKRAVATPVRVATKGVRAVSRIIGRVMPDWAERAIERGVRAAIGNRSVTTATKATILPIATAAALAVPGVQPFAVGVPVVVNAVLDKLISEAKGGGASKSVTTPTAPGASFAQRLQAKQAASEKLKSISQKLKAAKGVAQEKRAAKIAEKEATQEPEVTGMSTGKKVAIGGGVLLLAALAYKKLRK